MNDNGVRQQLQRLDPWMILWPVLILGLVGLSSTLLTILRLIMATNYLEESSSIIDDSINFVLGSAISKFVIMIMGLLSGMIGFYFYKQLNIRNDDSPEELSMTFHRRSLWLIIILDAILIILHSVLGYPFELISIQEQFLSDLILIVIAASFTVIGLGIISDYYDLSTLAHSKDSHIEAYAVWINSSPSVVITVSDTFGGIFHMLFDPRLNYILFKTVRNPLGHWKQKRT